MRFSSISLALTAAVAACTASAAQAQTIVGLVDGATLVMIDAKAKKVTSSVKVSGAKLAGIDVRPANGWLYGVTVDGGLVTIDPKTGKTEMRAQISEKLPAGAKLSVDFNPVADRLRVIGSDGTSLRINVEDGKAVVDGRLKYADADANNGKTPMAMAAAYSNSFAGTKETALYDIDATTGALVKQAPPNDGILNTLGSIGMKVTGPVAFDILSDGKGGNWAWLMAGGKLHSVDLATGATKAIGPVAGLKGQVSDIAILPMRSAPSS
jgi:outer membrane protein assembly factor BamB